MSHNAKRLTPSTPDHAPAPPKRQRVSRACDACRSAKDKCDGARPRCQRCTSLRRQCTYLNPGKRRGIRTGYLRAMELALALLLESLPACEGVLLRALAEHGASLSGAVLDKDSPSGAAEGLLGRWHGSEAFRAVGRLISRDEDAMREDGAVNDDETGPVTYSGGASGRRIDRNQELVGWKHNSLLQTPSPTPRNDAAAVSLLQLPRHFRIYLDAYFASSHSPFPIADEEGVLHLAESYPPTGVKVNPYDPSYAFHSELWSVLAIGAALSSRRRPLGNPSGGRGDEPSRGSLYATARKLLPLEDGTPTSSHVRSLLLLSLAKLAGGETSAAWLLIGQAVTLLLQLVKNHGGYEKAVQDRRGLLMACFVLDTLVSLAMGNPSHMRSLDLPNFLNSLDPQLGNRRAQAVSDRPDHLNSLSSFDDGHSPLASLLQQYKFAKVLSRHLAPEMASTGSIPSSGASDLVESLDPPFHFCNSLVQGSIPRKSPGAALAQAGFLASSILLSPTPQPRLIQSLVDTVSQHISSTFSDAPPPLLTVYVELATQDSRVTCLAPDERARTAALVAALRGRVDNLGADPNRKAPEVEQPGLAPQPVAGLMSESPLLISHVHGAPLSRAHPEEATRYHAFGVPDTLQPIPNDRARNMTPLNPVLNMGLGSSNSGMVAPGMPEGYTNPTDYDAILDELSSLEYVDSNDPDPQFMANLGFAPGSELNDMFGGHFGLV